MTLLDLEDVADDGIGPISLRFEAGVCTVLGDSLAALACLSEIVAGIRRARRGRALLDGRDVGNDPLARRSVASLLPNEVTLAAASVTDAFELAARLRGGAVRGSAVLERAGLSRFGAVVPEQLGPREQRALALAFALARDDSQVLLLHDPFSLHDLVPESQVVARCRELATHACVIVTTTRLEDAIALGGSICRIERGRRVPDAFRSPARGASVGLFVRSERADRLAQLCASQPGIQYVLFDSERSPRDVLLFGSDLPSLAHAVLEVARQSSIAVDALAPVPPPEPSVSA